MWAVNNRLKVRIGQCRNVQIISSALSIKHSNYFMRGIDKCDQTVSSYLNDGKCNRFFYLLYVSLNNAYILVNATSTFAFPSISVFKSIFNWTIYFHYNPISHTTRVAKTITRISLQLRTDGMTLEEKLNCGSIHQRGSFLDVLSSIGQIYQIQFLRLW